MKEITYLSEYRPSPFTVVEYRLEFIIEESSTRVDNTMLIRRVDPSATQLILDGEDLDLELVWCDDELLESYARDAHTLTIPCDRDEVRVRIINRLYPDTNTALEGLYRSGGIWCTQNEPEGFRRITYCIDRPDVMARFTTKIIADRERAPILLSNGNLRGTATLETGKHLVLWEDPIPKPCYLFALVAGDLGSIHDTFVTMSGTRVELAIYCDRGNESKCHHAMRSLKKAMEWDEITYGREYDLEVYNIVAVESFNMGAMENKGLNIFNAHYVLADESSATDSDFLGIESVIAHEYFHNWTGNRITCRNWFELTLKEGLTVFRDQCFSADMHSAMTQRIDDVRALRERQFPEDAGPTAHPIKPDHYRQINNFYTATVYEKGAEVIRMLYTLLGADRFRAAMEHYFRTYDTMAVGTEEFLASMQTQSPIDLERFTRWYHQERTPTLEVRSTYDQGRVVLELIQHIPLSRAHQPQLPYAFPLDIALFGPDGVAYALHADRTPIRDSIFWIDEEHTTMVFEAIEHPPILSINRGFSAPIQLDMELRGDDVLMHCESDGFARYEATQRLARASIERYVESALFDERFVDGYGVILSDTQIDMRFKAQLLELPSLTVLVQTQAILDVAVLHRAREALKRHLAQRYKEVLLTLFQELRDQSSVGGRFLLFVVADTLLSIGEAVASCVDYYYTAKTMSERLALLRALECYSDAAQGCLDDFYQRYRHDSLTFGKYLTLIASSSREGVLGRIGALVEDSAYDEHIPNLVRAVYGSFGRNLIAFHTEEGYAMMSEAIIHYDTINPQVAAALCGAFRLYGQLPPAQREIMKQNLTKIRNTRSISSNVYEIVEQTLEVTPKWEKM